MDEGTTTTEEGAATTEEEATMNTEEEALTLDENGVAVFPQKDDDEATMLGDMIMTQCGMKEITEVPSDAFGNLQLSYHN